LCFFSKAELYQPGEAVLPAVGVFQKYAIVAASDPKALEILEANPNPVEAPITTFLAPFIAPLILHIQFDFFIFCSHPSGWAVKQINPLILGSIIFNR
jgi:hypothetical protein